MNSVNSLVRAVRACRALDADQLDELERKVAPRFPSDPHGLAGELLQRRWLTPFQVDRLLTGRGAELLLGGSYVLLERLGEGGMGQVFKARNWKIGRTVALKRIHKDLLADDTAVERFRREIRATAQLDHPNIVHAYDADETDDGLFIDMEYVEGVDLGRRVEEAGPLPVAEACDCVRQAARGLQHAHEKGLVHRDLKPSNLLRAEPGGAIKLLDLGLARLQRRAGPVLLDAARPGLTQLGVILGTVDFLAPEQARDSSAVDTRADLYSLGCTFYFLLTGRPPYPGGTPADRLIRHTTDPLPPLKHVPATVEAVVHRLMAKAPGDRYPAPADLVRALDALLAEPGRLAPRLAEALVATVPLMQLPAPAPGEARVAKRGGPRRAPSGPRPADPAPPVGPSRRRRPSGRAVLVASLLLGSAVVGAALAVGTLASASRPSGETVSRPPSTAAARQPAVAKAPPRPDPPRDPLHGLVRSFWVTGPFGWDLSTTYPPEANADPGATYTWGPGEKRAWKEHPTEANGLLRLPRRGSWDGGFRYALAFVHSPRGQKATMTLGSGDRARVWVNGARAHDVDRTRATVPDEDRVEVSLKQGRNVVLIKLGGRGRWPYELYLRFSAEAPLSTSPKAVD